MFLSKEELHELTGYERKADQRRWLKNHVWKFEVSAIGWPVVSKNHAEAMLGGIPAGVPAPKKEWEPNREALRKLAK